MLTLLALLSPILGPSRYLSSRFVFVYYFIPSCYLSSLYFLSIWPSKICSWRFECHIYACQGIAEANFPPIDNQHGMVLSLTDVFNKNWQFRYRFWINNTSRMYLIEGTQELQQRFRLTVGDVLMFAKDPSNVIYICGRKGTREDIGRKSQTKRTLSSASSLPSGNRSSRARGSTSFSNALDAGGAETINANDGRKRMMGARSETHREYLKRQKDATNSNVGRGWRNGQFLRSEAFLHGDGHPVGVSPMDLADDHGNSADRKEGNVDSDVQQLYTYWNGLSLPARMDGVFRAVPPEASGWGGSNAVLSQYGFWTAIVSLHGEQYQAFFDGKEAAFAALEAALQNEEYIAK